MAKQTDLKIKYGSERVRALKSVLVKRNTSLETELIELLDQLYKKSFKQEVREFIEEIEESQDIKKSSPRVYTNSHQD